MIEKNQKKKIILNSFLVLIIFLIDRISKIYVIYLDKKFFGSEIFSSQYLNINLIWNDGIAFGLFSLEKSNMYNFLTFIIIGIITVIIFMIVKAKGLKKYSLLMILGGAIGNVFDRLFNRSVPDFIDFHIGNFHWFIFNIADVFITIGVIFMILIEIIGNNRNLKI